MVDAVIGGAFTVFIEFVKCLGPPIGNQITHWRNYKTNLDTLKHEVEKLIEAKDSVDHTVDEARRNGREIEQKVLSWLTSFDEIITEADQIIIEAGKIIEEGEQAKSHCFKGLCRPNWKTRCQFSRNAEEKVNAIVKLQREGNFPRVSYTTVPQEIWIPATKGFESFESRSSILQDIRKALSDPSVNMIGVYGMGGIGKTTLVKEIARRAEKEKLFDEVVFAQVSQTPDMIQIQDEIAERLGLEFREQTESGRARKLRQRLSREKKILIILDDVWTRLDLESIGIPFGDDHKGCKVLLTSRDQDVLSSKMDCDRNFLVSVLNEEEAWNLFKKMVGEYIHENSELQLVAIEVAKKCGGLPIAIVAIARALRNKGLLEWKNALQELRKPSRSNMSREQGEVYSTMELSYNYLENEELKSTLLLCCLMKGQVHLMDLLRYSMGLGLLQGTDTLAGAQSRIYSLVSQLKASCLLLDGETNDQISLHDVVRDAIISIACRDKHVIRDENFSDRWLNNDTMKSCTAIVLRECDITELLTESLECPQLRFLHFEGCQYSFNRIPDNFFTGMTKLQVLDLTDMELLSIPSSIHLLGNLRTLCLDHCVLGEMAIIGELKKLEILSFVGSYIEQLPREIGQLSWLRLLDLTDCSQLKVIPPNVLSSLLRLEELYMGKTFIQWETEGFNIERKNASLQELKHLTRLTSLEIHIKDSKILPKGLFSEKLEKYEVYIGDEWSWSRKYEGTRILKLKLDTNIHMKLNQFIIQLKGIEVLHLDEVQGISNVLSEVDKEGFPQLKHLHVQNNPYFQCIVDSTKRIPHDAFPQLESLFLSSLINLEKITHGQLAAASFSKLNSIKVENCDKLKNIFSISTVKSLPQLRTIEMTKCKVMEEIFAVGRKDDVNGKEVIGVIEFGIRFLSLKCLPQLSSFCSKVKIPSTSQIRVPKDNEVVLEDKHDTPTTLFNEMVVLPNLEVLEVSAIDCEKIWLNKLSAMSSCFENITRLVVRGCRKLRYIFSSSMVRSFIQLQHLEICKCPLVEEIIATEEIREEEWKDIIFPLKFLKIEDLENLTTFCTKMNIGFLFLKQLRIEQCPKFKVFVLENTSTNLIVGEEVIKMRSMEIQPFFNDKVAFPDLEEMVISHLDELKMIWHNNKLGHNSFDKLKLVEIESCDKLSTLFPSNVQRFSRLESITVNECGLLEEIFGLPGSNFEETDSMPAFQLERMSVFKCQNLKRIFPASIAQILLQLKGLKIFDCRILKEIVAKEGREANTPEFFFPKVATLVLSNLPALANFYPGAHTSEWPLLEALVVQGCGKVKVFTSKIFNLQEINGESHLDIQAQQPFFLLEKIIPNLEVLALSSHDIMTIWQGQFPEYLFSKLKSLGIRDDESAVFPLGLLEKLCNVDDLRLRHGSYKELFSYGEVEKRFGSLARIKKLLLESLSDLKCLWKQDSMMNTILQNLERLEVENCDNLINLVPSSASFQNLTILEVCYCKGMKNLVTSSTAKSLERLKEMSIEGCKGMTEIVANEGDGAEDEIVFKELKDLLLIGLESLTSFCSANYTFKFPSLDLLILRDCPMMKNFCEGALSTPVLDSVCQNFQDWELRKGCWDGDLKTTVKLLHHKKNVQSCNEDSGQPSMHRLE